MPGGTALSPASQIRLLLQWRSWAPTPIAFALKLKTRFRNADPPNSRFFVRSPQTERWHFDLAAYVAHRLNRIGITAVEILDACTYEREGEFFSYRRATHRKEPDYGRELSAITLTA